MYPAIKGFLARALGTFPAGPTSVFGMLLLCDLKFAVVVTLLTNSWLIRLLVQGTLLFVFIGAIPGAGPGL